MKAFRAWLFLLGLISACSSDNTPNDGGTDAATNDVTTKQDASNDVAQGTDTSTNDVQTSDVTTTDASDGGSGNFTLTINDYLTWCNVTVNGGTPSNSAVQTFQFAPDASVSLHGDTANASLFYWGYWQAPTLADGGKDTNMNVTVDMNGNVTILACCPDNNTPLSCP